MVKVDDTDPLVPVIVTFTDPSAAVVEAAT
jgi:hypothetical protein